jgi:hypothetical protein
MPYMDSCPRVWNLLHDATIVRIAGTVPGNLDVELEIDYLRAVKSPQTPASSLPLLDGRSVESVAGSRAVFAYPPRGMQNVRRSPLDCALVSSRFALSAAILA